MLEIDDSTLYNKQVLYEYLSVGNKGHFIGYATRIDRKNNRIRLREDISSTTYYEIWVDMEGLKLLKEKEDAYY